MLRVVCLNRHDQIKDRCILTNAVAPWVQRQLVAPEPVQLHRDHLDIDGVEVTLDCLIKDEHDLDAVRAADLVSAATDERSNMTSHDLLTHLAGFARALRARRVRVSPGDEIDAAAALTLVDLFDREEVRLALRTVLRIRRQYWPVFEDEFQRLWLRGELPATSPPASAASPPRRSTSPVPNAPRQRSGFDELAALGADTSEGATPEEHPGYSPDAVLRRKPFDQCTPSELRELERLLERITIELATRPSRRLVPARSRGFVDLRRSFRHAIATRGDFVRLARRERAIEEPKLVLLCDTSRSMDVHSRFFLAFILALKRVARRTEAFAFNTKLTRLTPWLAPGKIGVTLDRFAAEVPDWFGGTRIGECLSEFVLHHQRSALDSDTVVIILSDGLDTGEPEVLAQAMRAIHTRARRVIWLNPLKGDVRYEPLARGMIAALPFVDDFASAHNLESLTAVARRIAWDGSDLTRSPLRPVARRVFADPGGQLFL